MSAPASFPPAAMPPNPAVPLRSPRTGPPGWVGLLLALPMLLGWAYWLVIPTVQTIAEAFTGRAPGVGDTTVPAAAQRGGSFPDAFDAAGRTVLEALLPTLVMLIVVPLLTLAAAQAPSVLRKVIRVVLSVLAAGFAPVLLVLAWAHLAFQPHSTTRDLLDSAPGVGAVLALGTLGLVAGIGVSVLLAAFRRRAADQRPGLGGPVAVWAVLVLGTLAIALQAVTVTLVLAPGRDVVSLGTQAYADTFRSMRFGQGAADSTVLFLPVAILGLAAGLILILARPRIELDPADRVAAPHRTRGLVLGLVALVVAAALLVVQLWPGLGLLTEPHTGDTPVPVGGTLRFALLPALLAAAVQVLLAYPAGIGIGAFRPLGRHSRWLLLPFLPWLFVTITPLVTISAQQAIAHDRLNTVLGAVPPILVSVPALVVFTLFGAGQGERWRAERAARRPVPFLRTVLLPSLPLVALVGLAAWLYEAHDVLWRFAVLTDAHTSADLTALRAFSSYTAQWPGLGLLAATAPLAVPALVVFAVVQIWYVDRLAIRLGDAPTDRGTPSGTGTDPVSAPRIGTLPPPLPPRPL